ncbi:MAG TPA: class F sortase [Candidatus Dojkabacteria bacterium]|nr:class F sortase [Candidatus Dojkabacteria bacterium]
MTKHFFRITMAFLMIIIISSWSLIGYIYFQEYNSKTETTSSDKKKNDSEVLGEKSKNPDVVTESTKKPSEKVIKEYKVAKDMPKKIIFPTLSKSGYIQQVGIDQENKIAVPTNIFLAGWYVNSVKPGEKGLSILDGHRDGVISAGIFHNIEKLKKGDRVMIEYGDESILYFEVEEVAVVDEKDSEKIMYSKRQSIESQLNLVSCIGTYNEKEQTYDKRVIVVTKLVEN